MTQNITVFLEAVQKKIIEDFTYIQNNHLHTTFGITFQTKIYSSGTKLLKGNDFKGIQ